MYVLLSLMIGCERSPDKEDVVEVPVAKEDCSDKKDNDGDQKIDCEDSDCQSSKACAPIDEKIDWAYIRKNIASIEGVIACSHDVILYKDLKEIEGTESDPMGDVEFLNPIHTYKGVAAVKSQGIPIMAPYHGPMMAVEVELTDRRKGWIDPTCYYTKSQVVNVRSDDVLNVRAKSTYRSKKLSTIPPNGSLFYHFSSSSDVGGMSNFISIVTLDGIKGYVNMKYVKDLDN